MFLAAGNRHDPVSVFELQSGVVYGGFNEAQQRPPTLSRVVVAEGDILRFNRTAFPARREPVRAVGDGMATANGGKAFALGPRRWAGLSGELSVTPSATPGLGELTNLTMFRWHDADGDHAVGVNVWEPFSQNVDTLHTIIANLVRQAPPTPAHIVRVVGDVPMTAAPSWMHDMCAASPLTRLACPTLLPQAHVNGAFVTVSPALPHASAASIMISIEWFGKVASQRNLHPPQFGHIEISEGHITAARHDAKPMQLDKIQIPLPVGTLPIPLGHPHWTPNPGLLIFGDCFGNHLCYRWHQTGHQYQIDLHAWYPLAHTADVLQAIVCSTPAAHTR